MTCEHVQLPGGGTAIVCGTKPWPRSKVRCSCGHPAKLLCDWKVSDSKTGTCDKPICARCTTSPAPDKDLCPEHAQAWTQWQQERRA